jgi:hypothetical protein
MMWWVNCCFNCKGESFTVIERDDMSDCHSVYSLVFICKSCGQDFRYSQVDIRQATERETFIANEA